MDNKRKYKFIYIIDASAPLQNIIRSFEISRRLTKKNIFPIIFTFKIRKNIQPNYNIISEIPNLFNIYKSLFSEFKNKYILYFLDVLFKIFFYMQLIPFLNIKIKQLLRENKDIKFIYASGPSFYTHIIGFLLKKKFKIPLVLEYRDPWSFNPYLKKNILSLIDLKIEIKTLKLTDMIITISPALIQFLKNNFPFIENKPIFSISHGLNIGSSRINFKKKSNKIIFTFTGTLYVKRNITPLLRIISDLEKENFFKNMELKIKIYGNYSGINLENVIKKFKIEKLINLGGFIPREKTFNEIMKSDLAIHIGENLNYPTIAFKVWDYISCRKKMLYLGREDSFTANFLKKNDLGIIIPINNFKKGKEMFKKLINDIKTNKFNNLIDEKKILEYSWDRKVEKFMDSVIKNIVK